VTYTKYLVFLLPLLAGCVQATDNRAIGGAGIGAGGVSQTRTAISGDPLTATLIGSTAAGVGGTAPTSDQIDLGQPVWK
jgi:hypothetical protein